MIILQEEQISFSDNSHLIGIPFILAEEMHAYPIAISRRDLRKYLETTLKYPIDFHFVFKGRNEIPDKSSTIQ